MRERESPAVAGSVGPDRVNDGEGTTGSSAGTRGLCQPFGEPADARVFVIGHDPRLQKSDVEATTAFFLDYLDGPKPSRRCEAAKYGLAKATVEYIDHLTGRTVAVSDVYVTNLCNEFLPHAPEGRTVLIPNEAADRGIAAIESGLSEGKPQVIIPMSLQVFYHLVRSEFVRMTRLESEGFLRKAAPRARDAARGAYAAAAPKPFLDVCGSLFYHGELAVVPVLHVKNWPLRGPVKAYESAMQAAVENIHACLGKPPSR